MNGVSSNSGSECQSGGGLVTDQPADNVPRGAPGDAYGGSNRFDTGYVSDAAPIIIGGCGRSGTTLMRVMLDSHRHICCGPETGLFFHERVSHGQLVERFGISSQEIRHLARGAGSRAEFIEKFFNEYSKSQSKRRWAEKTPRNVEHLEYIFRVFPNARFIHMIRDGRDVACSLRTHPRYKVVDGELVPQDIWNPLEQGIARWTRALSYSKSYRTYSGYLEVRYEDLVLAAEPTLQRVVDFVGEPWDDSLLRYAEIKGGSRDVTKFPQNPEATKSLSDTSIGRWKSELSKEEQSLFKELAGDYLIELGYEDSHRW